MTEVKVVYLHGIRGSTSRKKWLDALNASLVSLGYTVLDSDDVIDFDYSSLLTLWESGNPVEPPETWSAADAGSEEMRYSYLRLAAYFRSWLQNSSAAGSVWTPPVPERAQTTIGSILPQFAEVRNYWSKEHIRHAVWNRIIAGLQGVQEVVIVGHSLGSVIAVDVISRLPASITVRGLITVACPLSVPELRRESKLMATEEGFPFRRVRQWINVYEPRDLVANRGGISQYYPMALDVDISTGPVPVKNHDVGLYSAHPAVAYAVRCALEDPGLPDRVEKHLPARRIDPQFRPLLLKFSYAQNHEAAIPMGQAERRRHVRLAREFAAKDAADLIERLGLERSQCPAESDFLHRATEWLEGTLSADELIPTLIQLMSDPLMPPYRLEADASTDVRLDALTGFITRLHITDEAETPSRDIAAVCQDSLRRARKYMSVSDGAPAWMKWALLSTAGLVAISGALFSLGAAAPIGLVGAAAITSALAAIGPGGMVGGLVTIGALAGLGGAAAAAGSMGLSQELHRQQVFAAMAEVAVATDAEGLRVAVAAYVATVDAQEKLHRESSRDDFRQLLLHIHSDIRARIIQARAIEPHGRWLEDLKIKSELLLRALAWLDSGQGEDPWATVFDRPSKKAGNPTAPGRRQYRRR